MNTYSTKGTKNENKTKKSASVCRFWNKSVAKIVSYKNYSL